MGKKKWAVRVVIIIAIIGYIVYWAFYDMGRLPQGKLIEAVRSPDGNYTVRTYLVEPSLSAPAVRGELDYNNENKKPKNIYWNYREDYSSIEWIDNHSVIINNHQLDVRYDKFDWRRKN